MHANTGYFGKGFELVVRENERERDRQKEINIIMMTICKPFFTHAF